MTIRKLPSGNYNAIVTYYDEHHHRKQKSFTAETKGRALKMARDFIGHMEELTDDQKITLATAMEMYIKTREGVLEDTTIRNYTNLSEKAFLTLQNKRLCDLKCIDIQMAVQQDAKHFSPKYIRNAYGLLKSVLKMYDISLNLSSIKLPKIQKKEKDLPDFETVFKIFKDTKIELPVLLAIWLSLRIGEVVGLKFKDVDFDNNLIKVRRTQILTRQGVKIRESCKTPKSTRDLQLPEYIMDLIKKVPHQSDEDFIVPMTDKALRSRYKRILHKNNLDITFHDLRHINASIMLMIGIPDKYAMERGGWATNNILKSVYQQTFSDERVKVDQKIDDYFNGIVQTVEQVLNETK